MITLSVILSIAWIALTAQAIYRRFFKKYADWDNHCTRHLTDLHYCMPEINLAAIILVILYLIAKYLP